MSLSERETETETETRTERDSERDYFHPPINRKSCIGPMSASSSSAAGCSDRIRRPRHGLTDQRTNQRTEAAHIAQPPARSTWRRERTIDALHSCALACSPVHYSARTKFLAENGHPNGKRSEGDNYCLLRFPSLACQFAVAGLIMDAGAKVIL